MTAKRDLKRRVRERQARTGESYVTARRHVVGEVADPEPAVAPRSAMQVVEMMSLSDDAARIGLRCNVVISPQLAERAEPAAVLSRLRDALVGTPGDPATALLRDLATSGRLPPRPARPRNFETVRRFFQRARAGLGGTTDDGSMLALPVPGRDGIVLVMCTVWRNDPSLVLTTLEELGDEEPRASARPALFLIFEGKRHEMSADQFVIGRTRTCDLVIRDGTISRKHATVIRRNDVFYLKDLGSVSGILYKGMRIDNKRIDEGDRFLLGGYELRFTYIASD